MKIRNGFVSNSSSSSFCIMGVVLPEDFDDESWDELDNKCYQRREEGKIVKSQWGIDEYYECKLVGASPEDMKDDETLIQFKERIVYEMKELGFDFELMIYIK